MIVLSTGSLSMTARGSKGPGKNIGISPDYGVFYADDILDLKESNINFDDDNIIYAIKKQIPSGYKAKRQPGNRADW